MIPPREDACEGLLVNGQRVRVPGVKVVTWEDDPRVPRAVHGAPRDPASVTGSIAHTSRGKRYAVTRDTGSPAKGLRVARYLGRRNRKKVSAHVVVAGDGTVYQMADLATWRANHAGTVNAFTFGVEVAQDDDDPSLTRAQVRAFVAVMLAAHDAMGLAKVVPMERGEHVVGDVRAWLSRKSGGLQLPFAGCAGHRCTSASRGEGDPGTPLVEALRAAGFVGATPAEMTLGLDARVLDEDDDDETHDEDEAPELPPLPSWLDPALEVDASRDLPDDLATLVRTQAQVLHELGVTGSRAAELLAHAATETGRGRRAHGHNYGGVKAKEREFREAAAKGTPLGWWRDLGHLDAGDDEVEYYRAWESDADFWRYFVKRFVGSPAWPPPSERYKAASRAFWGPTPSGWFVELVRAGYRGDVRRRELERILAEGQAPEAHPSVAAHRSLVARVQTLLGAGARA